MTANTNGALVARPKPDHHEPYDEDVATAALTELALCGGSGTRAVRRLKEKGIEVARTTLVEWRDDTRSEEYAAIRDETAARVQRIIAAEHEDLAIKGAELTRELLTRTKERIGEIPDRDLPGALRNAATATAISTDKALMARERPVVMPPASRNLDEVVKGLEALGVLKQIGPPAPVIEGDAVVVGEPS